MSPSFNAYLSDDPEQAKAIHRHAARGADMKACEVSLHTPSHAAEQRFHWIHVPATEVDRPDTVAIVFTHKRDLEEWRGSAERESWLQRGATLARREHLLKATSAFQLTRDDGSLGGWLPADGLGGGGGGADGVGTGGAAAGGDAQPPPAWRISATVLLAMYPMQELNRLVLLPALGCSDAWCALPASMQLWATCAWTCLSVTAVLLPPARGYTQRVGFMPAPATGGEGGGGAHEQHTPPSVRTALAAAGVPLAYAVSVGAGTALSMAMGVC